MEYPTISITPKRIREVQGLLESDQIKSKASVSISGGVLKATDILAGESGRSAFVERALRWYIRQKLRAARGASDIELINAHAKAINREAADLMSIQSWPE